MTIEYECRVAPDGRGTVLACTNMEPPSSLAAERAMQLRGLMMVLSQSSEQISAMNDELRESIFTVVNHMTHEIEVLCHLAGRTSK